MTALILALKYWKYVVALLAFGILGAYTGVVVLERNHYKSSADAAKLALDTLVADAAKRERSLQADMDAITAKYASAHSDANTLAIEAARLTQEGIARDKELASVRLSLNAVRMFNAPKQHPPEAHPAPEAVSGDAGKAGAPATADAPGAVSAFTLADLLSRSAQNDVAHLACIAQVEAWQHFWSDFTAAVAASEAE